MKSEGGGLTCASGNLEDDVDIGEGECLCVGTRNLSASRYVRLGQLRDGKTYLEVGSVRGRDIRTGDAFDGSIEVVKRLALHDLRADLRSNTEHRDFK